MTVPNTKGHRQMDLGKDFFSWFRFVVATIKLFIQIFGNGEEKNELKRNHIDPDNDSLDASKNGFH